MYNYSEQDLQIYHDELFILRKQLFELDDEKKFIQLQLKHFYHILNKNVRFMFISDIRNYFKKFMNDTNLQYEERNNKTFNEIERKIRTNPYNDHTVNFMISGFMQALDGVTNQSVRAQIIEFILELMRNMHKYTAMCYLTGNGGGLILYKASFMEHVCEVTPDVIFYYGPPEISV